MSRPLPPGRRATLPSLFLALALFAASDAVALDSPLEIGQYAHTSWTVRDGYSPGLVFAITQTPDGYLWLGSEYGLFRFDGLRFSPWHPPGRKLPGNPYSLLVSRDGTLWIGTFEGLVSWNGTELTEYPEIDQGFVTSLLEDRDGTIWAGILANKGKLCEIRAGKGHCHDHNGEFGGFVWSLAEDGAGVLWAGAESGLWRWKPGPPKRFELPGARVSDLVTTADGRLLFGIRGAGLRSISGERMDPYLLRGAGKSTRIPDSDVKSNKLLRDRDGGIWIGTDGKGLLHVRDGTADAFGRADGLSGNVACSLFEDREGNIWYASEHGLDRFRKVAVATITIQQGLSSDVTKSVLASADGSTWVATNEGLTRWKDAKTTVFGAGSGLPDLATQSLFQDSRGRLWVSTNHGLAWFDADRFVGVPGLPSKEVSSITGDDAGNLWLSGNDGLARFQEGKFVENIPWSAFGRRQQAKVIVADTGGVWLSFWQDGGVSYFKDGKVRTTFTPAQGLGAGHVSGLRLDGDGAVWAATEEGGLSRIKEGHVSTLSTRNGLPCNTVHWSMDDDHRSLWMFTGCGLVRIMRDELDAWIANPTRRVDAKRWDAADGVPLRAVSPAYFNPPVAKAADGKLWFVSGEGVQVIDPDHLPFNPVPPPVYIERVVADHQAHSGTNGLRLPPLVRDVTIEFTALSLGDPQDVHFRYRLDGHDDQWQDAVDRRQVSYTNLPPARYRFEVKAANNSGIWNEQPARLEFVIAPAYYQTPWFRVACVVAFITLIWGGVQLRLQRLRRDEKRLRDIVERIPAMAFSVHPDGSPDLVNQRWLDFTGLPASAADDEGDWGAAIHPEDVAAHIDRWRAALTSGEPFESEARYRRFTGEFRWFLVQAVPLRDKHGKIVKWYGTLTDIEERKKSELERERLRRLESHLAHTNRLSMLGELTASLAHEINQPIGAVVASAGAGSRWLDRDPPDLERAREAMVRIKDDGKRAADIIAGLKAFYRKEGAPQRTSLDVNEVVREMLVLLHREAERHSVVMRTELVPRLPAVRADRVQIQQVLMNLMVNAFEAMGDEGGELTITTKPHEGGIVVSVSDTGAGIPADKLEQIFSTFVTSKAAGTGMGLAISRTIVESHDGKLWAEADTSRGATFHFTLPAELPPGDR